MSTARVSEGLVEFIKKSKKIKLLTTEDEILLSRQVQEALKLKKDPAFNIETASREELLIIKRGDKARNEMITANIRLAHKIALKYSHMLTPAIALDDLTQEGILGVHRAIETFDGSRGYKFSTYASRWIMHNIQRYIQYKNKIIRMPVHIAERFYRINKAISKATNEFGKLPSPAQLEKYLGIDELEIRLMLERADTVSADNDYRDNSYSASGNRTISYITALPWKPDENQEDKDKIDLIVKVISCLAPRHQRIMKIRFGLVAESYGGQGRVNNGRKYIGAKMNIGEAVVYQIENYCIAQIKRMVIDEEFPEKKEYGPMPKITKKQIKEINSLNEKDRLSSVALIYEKLLGHGMLRIEACSYLCNIGLPAVMGTKRRFNYGRLERCLAKIKRDEQQQFSAISARYVEQHSEEDK